jgi:hypothetical protein
MVGGGRERDLIHYRAGDADAMDVGVRLCWSDGIAPSGPVVRRLEKHRG